MVSFILHLLAVAVNGEAGKRTYRYVGYARDQFVAVLHSLAVNRQNDVVGLEAGLFCRTTLMDVANDHAVILSRARGAYRFWCREPRKCQWSRE